MHDGLKALSGCMRRQCFCQAYWRSDIHKHTCTDMKMALKKVFRQLCWASQKLPGIVSNGDTLLIAQNEASLQMVSQPYRPTHVLAQANGEEGKYLNPF